MDAQKNNIIATCCTLYKNQHQSLLYKPSVEKDLNKEENEYLNDCST